MAQTLARSALVVVALWQLAAASSSGVNPIPQEIAHRLVSVGSRLALTYDNLEHTDGFGAQLQRVYAIYGITRLLKVPYYHTPLVKVDYQGLDALLTNTEDDQMIARYNDLFTIPSDIDDVTGWRHKTGLTLTWDEIDTSLRELEEDRNLRILCSIWFPYIVAEQFTGQVYRAASTVSPFRHVQPTASLLRVAIHVRRGDELLRFVDRMLPNSYYIKLAQQLANIFTDMRVPFVFELFTEVPKNATIIRPGGYDSSNLELEHDVVLDPSQNAIPEFDAIPNLIKAINTDQIYTLERMATAHMLIMSRSSYSYLAAGLNEPALIFYPKFWHPPPPHWILLTEQDAPTFTPEQDHHIRDWVLNRFPRNAARANHPVRQRSRTQTRFI